MPLDETSDRIGRHVHASILHCRTKNLKRLIFVCIDGFPDGYFTTTELGEEHGTSRSRRIAATGIAVTTLGLGFAVPARADDAAPPTDAPAAPVDAAVVMPTAPDVSAAVTQLGAANVNVSIRIGSPGDNGGVTQTVSSAADAAAAAGAQSPAPPAPPQATAGATQSAPTNVDLSVRVASPGADGAVTQTITATAAAQTQYQAPTMQYQSQTPTTSTSAAAPAVEAAPTGAAAPTTAAPPSPSGWTWNWTWTCGDTTEPGITHAIDTGIQGWVWNWNLQGMCGEVAPPRPNSIPLTLPQLTLPQSSVEIVPVVPPTPPAVVLPAPPSLPAPPVIAPLAAPPAIAEPPPIGVELFPAPGQVTAVGIEAAGPISLTPLDEPAPFVATLPATLRWKATQRVEADHAATRPGVAPLRPVASTPDAGHTTTPVSFAGNFPTAGGGPGGGSGGGGGGVTAALAIWLLVLFPGLAVLRLPASRRAPRGPVEEIHNRPG